MCLLHFIGSMSSSKNYNKNIGWHLQSPGYFFYFLCQVLDCNQNCYKINNVSISENFLQ